jgi:hypothetical protein
MPPVVGLPLDGHDVHRQSLTRGGRTRAPNHLDWVHWAEWLRPRASFLSARIDDPHAAGRAQLGKTLERCPPVSRLTLFGSFERDRCGARTTLLTSVQAPALVCRAVIGTERDGLYRLALRLRTFQQRDQTLTGFRSVPNLSKSNRGLFLRAYPPSLTGSARSDTVSELVPSLAMGPR